MIRFPVIACGRTITISRRPIRRFEPWTGHVPCLRHERALGLLFGLHAAHHGTWAASPGVDFEAAGLLALEDRKNGLRYLNLDLAEAFPLASSRAGVLETFERLRDRVARREFARGDSIGGNTNVRDCRQPSAQVLDCVWFLFVPPPRRETAMAEGIYGFT